MRSHARKGFGIYATWKFFADLYIVVFEVFVPSVHHQLTFTNLSSCIKIFCDVLDNEAGMLDSLELMQ